MGQFHAAWVQQQESVKNFGWLQCSFVARVESIRESLLLPVNFLLHSFLIRFRLCFLANLNHTIEIGHLHLNCVTISLQVLSHYMSFWTPNFFSQSLVRAHWVRWLKVTQIRRGIRDAFQLSGKPTIWAHFNQGLRVITDVTVELLGSKPGLRLPTFAVASSSRQCLRPTRQILAELISLLLVELSRNVFFALDLGAPSGITQNGPCRNGQIHHQRIVWLCSALNWYWLLVSLHLCHFAII